MDEAAKKCQFKIDKTSYHLKRRAEDPNYAMPEEVHWLEHQWYVSHCNHLAKVIGGTVFVIRKEDDEYKVLIREIQSSFVDNLPGLYDSAEEADEAAFREYLMRINLGIIEFRKKLDSSVLYESLT